MQRFGTFLVILLVTFLSFYFMKKEKKLSLPLKTITLEQYKAKYPKNVTYIKLNEQDPEEFIAVLNNGYVFEDGRVITEQSEILEEVAVLKYGANITDNPLLKRTDFPKPKEVGGTMAVIASNGEENYYHWVFHVLPRIKLLQESKIPFDKVYIYNLIYPYQKQSIRLLGIDESKIYSGKGENFIQAEKLLVPSIAVKPAVGKAFPNWVIEFLNKSFLHDNIERNSLKKIYISRSNANSRRIVNEEGLLRVLESRGYKKVLLEDLPVREQARLFHNAQEIIAPHGSALSNLIFCKKGTKIIEINPYKGHKGPYKMLSKQIGLNHIDIDTDSNELTQKQINQNDIYVDINKMLKFIN